MTEIILTPTEVDELKTFLNVGLDAIINNIEDNTVTLSDVQLGEVYDILMSHAENTVVFNIVLKILKNAPNNIIKPIVINKI